MYEKQTLPNGVRIVYEHMPHVRSAAIGVWVGVGSRYESPCEAGSAHFIEHMLFKGTAQHSASELAERMDAIGGQVNAYTTREGTCYYARVLDEHLDRAGDLLAEMLFTSNFSETDADNERGVIREEMDMYADTPEDLVTERLIGAAFPGALGRPVLGRPATIDRLTGARLRSFQIAHYIAPRIVIAVSGSFTDENIARLAAHFSWLPVRPDLTMRSGSYTPAFALKRKAIEQNQISIGFPGLPTGAEERFTMALLSSILGGNMSSRLFQTVREKNGLCYAIYTYTASFLDCGMFGISAAVGRETEQRALALIRDELERFRTDGVTQSELDRARLVNGDVVHEVHGGGDGVTAHDGHAHAGARDVHVRQVQDLAALVLELHLLGGVAVALLAADLRDDVVGDLVREHLRRVALAGAQGVDLVLQLDRAARARAGYGLIRRHDHVADG